MTQPPDIAAFKEIYDAGGAQLIWRRLVSDLETPVSAYLKLAATEQNTIFLESVEGGEQLGRYSIIGLKPDVIWRCFEGQSELNRTPGAGPFTPQSGAPLQNLKRLLKESEIDPPPGLPPMAAGIFGYLGYDMVRQMERLGPRPAGGTETPDSIFVRPTLVAIFDNIRQEIILITPSRPKHGVSANRAYQDICNLLDEAETKLSSALPAPQESPKAGAAPAVDPISNTDETQYCAMVDQTKDYIAAGDIFQAVLSQCFSADFDAPPFELYRALRRSNPSPFLFLLNFENFALVGSSPEILVRVRNGEVTIRPIAGTRPRGKTPKEDRLHEESLLADPKERAEHLMLLDLGRNDVSRSSEVGSVKVTESFKIERYSHVMHIVSNVTGQLADNTDAIDAVIGGFPAGTVSGAPKIRAMEIIDELESSARGVYGGAIGYFSADGNVDTCIALRTAVLKDGKMYVQAGAGIVADSDPMSEQRECENKARALFAAASAALS